MRSAALLPLALALAACSQPSGSSLPGAPAPASANAASAVTGPAQPSSHGEGDEHPLSSAPFSNAAQNFEVAKKALLDGYFHDSISEDDLYRAAVAGMVERVDPAMAKWNRLLGPEELVELRTDLQGELVGIGVKIDFDPATGYIDVKSTVAGSPAERAGIAPPDKIVSVDGKLYKGMRESDVVSDIRGKAGEKVVLSVLRGAEILTVPVVREKIVFDAVQDLVMPGDVGYLRIPSFNAKTPGSLHDALADLAGKHVHALVVDLRHNPGGSFDDCVAAAGELVPAGSLVGAYDKRGRVERLTAKTTPMLVDLPMSVLVNHDTASSAELLAAALQEQRHATLVGTITHGKWTVQRIEDLPNGYALKFTVGVFTSPSGKSYEGKGMPPDVEVDQADTALERAFVDTDPAKRVSDDVQLRTALMMLRR
jgi:carboxyl-terminal processing protease